MSSNSSILLQTLLLELRKLDSAVVGSPKLYGDAIVTLDGRVRITAQVPDVVHAPQVFANCHFVTEVRQPVGRLVAYVMGMHEDLRSALADATYSWTELVAGPLFSMLHDRSVLNGKKLEADDASAVEGGQTYVGPMRFRAFDGQINVDAVRDCPMFDCVSAMAEPSDLQLVKVTLDSQRWEGWNRNIEIDGNVATHADRPWPDLAPFSGLGVGTRYAVVRFGDSTPWMEARKRLDAAIQRFVALFQETGNTLDAADRLEAEGTARDIAHRIREFVPIALGRILLQEMDVKLSSEFVLIRRDGSIAPNMRLMCDPVFARTSVLGPRLMASELCEAAKALAMSGAEVDAVMKATERSVSPRVLKTCGVQLITTEVDISPDARMQGMRQVEVLWGMAPPAQAAKKTWWKFW